MRLHGTDYNDVITFRHVKTRITIVEEEQLCDIAVVGAEFQEISEKVDSSVLLKYVSQ
jgi:hypothetical protein